MVSGPGDLGITIFARACSSLYTTARELPAFASGEHEVNKEDGLPGVEQDTAAGLRDGALVEMRGVDGAEPPLQAPLQRQSCPRLSSDSL